MSGVPIQRRTLLAATAGAAMTGCTPDGQRPTAVPMAWVGAGQDRGQPRGHRLRSAAALPLPAVQRHANVLVLGGGIAGLAAARGLMRRGVQDVQVLEMEDSIGGNSRGHLLAGIACPLGAHYLPVPDEHGPAREVAEWLYEIGLLRHELGRSVADERHLCHSPQERLFIEGAWAEGLLPPVDRGSAAATQMRRFAQAVTTLARTGAATGAAKGAATGAAKAARRAPAFALPAHRSAWGPVQAALDNITFAHWLDSQGFTDPHLRWYLDYGCRDDYGADAATVSAWAGVHYFASRHGFHAPGDMDTDTHTDSERDAVFTWPDGNAWLAQRLAAPLLEGGAGRISSGQTVLRVTGNKHAVQVLAWNESSAQLEGWTAQQVVLALPLMVAARVLESPPQALQEATALLSYAPWLVANLHLPEPLLARPGAAPAWDNVIYGSSGLGYVDAMHQSLRPVPGATVLTAYHALPRSQRAALLASDPRAAAQRVLNDLQTAHPDIHRRVQRVDLMRWGHAMVIPQPGLQRHPALMALRAQRGRVRFAHADLAGYSVFEEAFTAGCDAALP